MSLDINWIILIAVFTALVIEVLAAVAYVFENCWTFDTPRTRTFHGDKAIRDFVPDVYTAVWTSEVIGVDKKQSGAIQGRVDPLAPSFGQKHRPSPRTGPTNRKLTPDNGPLIRVAARISSWMTALASRTIATVKPMRDGNIETQSPSHTKVEPTVGTCTTTDSSLTSQRHHPQGAMLGLACSSGVVAFQGIKAQTSTYMSTSISPAGDARLLVTQKVLKVSAVEGLHVPGYQSLTVSRNAGALGSTLTIVQPTVRVSAGAINRAGSLAAIGGRRGNCTRAPSKPPKKPYHPTHLFKVGAKEVPRGLKDAAAIFGPAQLAIAHLEPEALPAQKSHPAPVFTPGTEPVPIIPAKRRLRAGVLET
ncbi:putative transmembrane protein, partial [Rhizoctonia solani 123E]